MLLSLPFAIAWLAGSTVYLAASISLLRETRKLPRSHDPVRKRHQSHDPNRKRVDYISSDISHILFEANARLNLVPREDEYAQYASVVHAGLIAGYENQQSAVSPLAGQSPFLDFAYEKAKRFGETAYKILETPDTIGMLNPRRVPLEKIVELAKPAVERNAHVSYSASAVRC